MPLSFPIHDPRRIEFIQQRKRWDCGVACVAMLAGLLYDDALSLFAHFGHGSGLFPDDVLEVLEDLGLPAKAASGLPKRQPALVAVDWMEEGLSGHYVVWDPGRRQFLDPLHGLVGRRELLRLCRIEHVWTIGGRNMRRLVRARMAKALAKRVLGPFGPSAICLSRTDDGFAIEVSFVSEPPKEARSVAEIGGFPVHMGVSGANGAREE